MGLITYYGKLEPKSLFRVIVDGDKVQGYVSTPAAPGWKKSGAVVSEVEFLAGHEALPISSEEALVVLNAWGGAFDALDGARPEPLHNYETEMSEEFGEDLLLTPLEVEEVEVVTIDEPEPVSMLDSFMESFDLWEPAAPVFEPVGEPNYATSEHLAAIEQPLVETPAVSEGDVKLNRLDAYSALRDLADGLSSLGRPGVGWA